jgi:shikimate kinase
LANDAIGERTGPGARHIVLVGLPGVGKTTVGRRVARLLRREFLDFDTEIERREGMAVTEIFASKGEAYFRELEYQLTDEVAHREPMVLSPGGGWICQRRAVELLGGTGRTIYLRVTPEAVYKRLKRVAERPLLAGPDPLGRLQKLYEERRHLYEGADAVVDSETLTKDEMIAAVAKAATALEQG